MVVKKMTGTRTKSAVQTHSPVNIRALVTARKRQAARLLRRIVVAKVTKMTTGGPVRASWRTMNH